MRAPAFTLPDHTGHPVSLADYAGKRLVIFFYPAAMTPGCTQEACDFRDSHRELTDAGYEVLGISPDPPDRNAVFREREGLTFPLLSDAQHTVAEAFGALGTRRNYGREYEGLIRSTFVIDEDGSVLREFRNVRATGHVERVKRDLLPG